MTTLTHKTIFSQLNSSEPFPIAFDDAWQWLGYSKKSNAKASFIASEFQQDLDYCLLIDQHSDNHKGLSPQELSVIRNKENIFLTVDCMKMWCMMSRTPCAIKVPTGAFIGYYGTVDAWKSILTAEEFEILAATDQPLDFEYLI